MCRCSLSVPGEESAEPDGGEATEPGGGEATEPGGGEHEQMLRASGCCCNCLTSNMKTLSLTSLPLLQSILKMGFIIISRSPVKALTVIVIVRIEFSPLGLIECQ